MITGGAVSARFDTLFGVRVGWSELARGGSPFEGDLLGALRMGHTNGRHRFVHRPRWSNGSTPERQEIGARDGAAAPRLSIDLTDDEHPRILRTVVDSNGTRAGRFLFGCHAPSSFAFRVMCDALFVALAMGSAILLLPVGRRAGLAHLIIAALIAGPVLTITGTYGFMGTPRRVTQFGRLFAGIGLGAGLEAALLALLGVEGTSAAVLGGWLGGGTLAAVARLAKTRFEDRFRILPRVNRPKGASPAQIDRPIRHVLVIGGGGYIGSVLVRQLLDGGYHVTVLDKLLYGDMGIVGLVKHPRFRLVRDDFRNVEGLVLAARGAEAVIHLGAIVGDPACSLDPEKAVDVNYRATRLIRNVCRGLGVQRLILASTCSVYGVNSHIIDENSELNPVSVYAASKIASERAILEETSSGLSPTVLRLATVFGWSPRPRFDLVVNLLTARATAGESIDIYNGGQWRPFIHVSDVGRAFIRCLEAPVSFVRDKTFNAGSDELNVTLEELGTTMEGLFQGLQVNRIENDSDPRSYHVSFQKISNELGFRRTVGLEQGIEEVRRMITETDILDHQNPRFSNVRLLQENPDLAFGPDEDEADSELAQLRDFYRTEAPSADAVRFAGQDIDKLLEFSDSGVSKNAS